MRPLAECRETWFAVAPLPCGPVVLGGSLQWTIESGSQMLCLSIHAGIGSGPRRSRCMGGQAGIFLKAARVCVIAGPVGHLLCDSAQGGMSCSATLGAGWMKGLGELSMDTALGPT